MEDETFFNEWFRTTWINRKRMIHQQLGELNEFEPMRLDLTPAERAVLEGTEIMLHRPLGPRLALTPIRMRIPHTHT